MKITLITLAAAAVLGSGVAAAQSPDNWAQHRDHWDDRSATINDREARITGRIERGMNDGRITDREARRLTRELNAIESKERAFKSDGRLSRRETDELNRDLNRLADHVRQQMRDEERY